MTTRRKAPGRVAVVVVAVLGAACSGSGSPAATTTTSPVGPSTTRAVVVEDETVLAAALAAQLLADGALRIDAATAGCVAGGTVEVVGAERLAGLGITSADPDGPDDDPYGSFTDDELADVVAVWDLCTDLPALITEALLSSAPDVVEARVEQCIQASLGGGAAARFLLAALRDAEGTDPTVVDVLRVLDGCTAGASIDELADVDPGLWPWLSVQVPGHRLELIDPDGDDARDLTGFLDGVASLRGVGAAAVRVADTTDGTVVAAMIVAAIDPPGPGGGADITVDEYVAGLVTAAGDAEVFEFPLPSGAEVIGWEAPDDDLVFLVWPGSRVVVFATGSVATVEVLSLYADLVPAP